MGTPSSRISRRDLRHSAGSFVLRLGIMAAFACAAAAEPVVPPHPFPVASSDLLILRSGQIQKGPLKVCVSDRCYLAATQYERETLAWIGLATAIATPPAVKDPSEDEIHLRDGSVHSGHLVGLSLGEVVTEKGSFDRSTVAWIHFAGAPSSPRGGDTMIDITDGGGGGDQGGGGGGGGKKTSSGGGSGADKGKEGGGGDHPKPPSGKTRPSHAPVMPCPPDKPLGGRIELDANWEEIGCRGAQHAVLRFPLVSTAVPRSSWLVQLTGRFTAPEVNYEISSGGCSGTPHGMSCQAPGGRASGTLTLGSVGGPLGYTQGGKGSLDFNPLDPQITANFLQFLGTDHPRGPGFSIPVDCVGPRESSHSGFPIQVWEFFLTPRDQTCSKDTPFVFCGIPPADCYAYQNDPAKGSECVLHADRHAVLPFSGDATWTSPTGHPMAGIARTEIHWKICCGCGEGPAPPGPASDPCGDTAQSDANAATNRIKRQEAFSSLERQWKAYEADMEEANRHLHDFQTAARACNVQNKLTDLLIGCLGLFSPLGEAEIAAEGGGAAEQIAEAAKQLGEQTLGDPGTLIMTIVQKMLNGEDPTSSAIPSETIKNFIDAVEAAEKALQALHGSNTEQLEEFIQQCGGTIGLSYETYHSAQEYVEKLKSGMEKLPEVKNLVNKIRQLDTDYPDLQYKAWADCVRLARCKGTPESACDGLKPPGNWVTP